MIFELIERLWNRPCSNNTIIELQKTKVLLKNVLTELDTRAINTLASVGDKKGSQSV